MISLVTGGAGFMGSHVVDELVKRKHKVIVLDDLSGGFEQNIPSGVEFFKGSVTNAALMNDLFNVGKFDYIFHLAAYAAEGLSPFIRRFNYSNNLLGSINLINNAVKYKIKCFVFTSSIAVYGTRVGACLESMTPEPEDPYGISKHAVELDLKAAHRLFGLNYIVFRPHNVYGERQNIGDPYRNVIGIFMNKILQGLPCPIFGDGTQTRAFTHISDVAPVIAESVHVPKAYNQVFNVGANTRYSVNTLAELVQEAMRSRTGTLHLPAREEVLHAFSDHSKLVSTFGYKPLVTLEEGLRLMADWVKEVGARKARPFGKLEIEDKLPPSWKELL